MDSLPEGSRRWRPRFSLLSALLLMNIAGMAIVIVQMWREVGPLRQEVRRLRDEVGELTIEDETKLHAIQVRTNDEMTWKFRFWIPPGADVSLKFKWGNIPLNTYPNPDIIKSHLHAGEQWVALSVQRDRAGEGWQCFLECARASDTTLPIPAADQWFLRPNGGFAGMGVGNGSKVDDADDGTKTFLLQRYREAPLRSPISAMDDPNDLPGFIIWLERQ